jgi:hypothetical protein
MAALEACASLLPKGEAAHRPWARAIELAASLLLSVEWLLPTVVSHPFLVASLLLLVERFHLLVVSLLPTEKVLYLLVGGHHLLIESHLPLIVTRLSIGRNLSTNDGNLNTLYRQ